MDAIFDKADSLDASDPLRAFRDEFALRDGLIYLDGNSLGAMPKRTPARMDRTIQQEWREGLITSWNAADWVNAPRRIGDKIAPIIGAGEGEVVVTDSTSINIFKALTAALSLQPERSILLTETTNFPTDHYMMQGITAFSGGRIETRSAAPEDVLDHLSDNVAVLLLTHVHYKTGRMRDMAAVTAKAQEHGVLVVWDLSHSAGAVELALGAANVDFAVGCGYKFLNGGPGAPAFLYAAKRHHEAMPVLAGWFGHARPFAFEEEYEAADNIERFLCGTPGILGMAALEEGVELMLRADMAEVRRKSAALGDLFIECMDGWAGDHSFTLVSPRDAGQRGSHVSYSHKDGYAMMQALKARDVIGDFREPDVMRFGLTPLYLSYRDMVEAAARLRSICESREWDRPEYKERAAVT
ncbi:kynureninase [Aurantiacibacter sediminis]|uniref:Kynureninase n=1 Tax=Aurantiacibacter sediminis TaxID=2793064 RepID=A0ABS0N132_9SPHN|nr:kynureninase [Aurantiacibacter sediminis]MBH5321669.1 kynureninase [Aurantiacibacter sediminis]